MRPLILLAIACCLLAPRARAYRGVGLSQYGGSGSTSCQPCGWAGLDWIVPDISYDTGSTAGSQQIFTWVGLDGLSPYPNGKLAQLGTSEYLASSGGTKTLTAFWELVGYNTVQTIPGFPVAVGDHIHAEVKCVLNCSPYLNTNMSIQYSMINYTQANYSWTMTLPNQQMGMGIAQYVNEWAASTAPNFTTIRLWNATSATVGAGALSTVSLSVLNNGWAGYIHGSDGSYRWESPSHPFGPLGDNFNICHSVTVTLNATAFGVPQCQASTYSGASGLGGR